MKKEKVPNTFEIGDEENRNYSGAKLMISISEDGKVVEGFCPHCGIQIEEKNYLHSKTHYRHTLKIGKNKISFSGVCQGGIITSTNKNDWNIPIKFGRFDKYEEINNDKKISNNKKSR